MPSHGSRRRRASRFGRFSTVNAFEIFCAPSSSQVSGADTVAPERGRPEALRAHLQAEIGKWVPIIQKAGIYAD